MAESGFAERYHVPQQSRRDKLRIVAASAASHNQQLQTGFLPILDPAIIPSDLITCAASGAAPLHHPPAVSKEESHSHSVMGYVGGVGGGGGMISSGSFSSSAAATNHELYVDPQLSVQLNPSPIQVQDISGANNPFLYSPQSLRLLQHSFQGGGEVVVYRPEPVSVGQHHGPNPNPNNNNSTTTATNDKSSNSSGHNTCGQGLSLSLSSHHARPTNLPLELNLQRYDAAEAVVSSAGCFLPSGGNAHDVSNSNELFFSSRSSVPLGPFSGCASALKGSRFLKPAQQLLEELCDVGRGVYADKMAVSDSILLDPSMENDDGTRSCIDGSENANTKKKSRLMSMLNEVYRRYKQYYQQMQAVISSFESVAGVKNAAPFASLALKAMSKHFSCLKNAIAEQLQLMIETRGHITNDTDSGPGFENPGTGIHCQRPPQNTGFVEHQPVWRPQRGLPERAVTVLRSWLFEHFLHPYPTDTDKLMLAKQTGLSRNQVSNWFINARVRLWKPMVEEIHMLETRQVQKGQQKEDQENADSQNDPMPSGINPTSCENVSSSASKRFRELGSKRSWNDLAVIPAGNEDNVANDLSYQNSASSSHVPSAGFGVGKAGGSTGGGVSLTLGLHQNNSLGFPDMFAMNAARRFGLDAAADGDGYAVGGVSTVNRQFGREIAGGQLLHDFVG